MKNLHRSPRSRISALVILCVLSLLLSGCKGSVGAATSPAGETSAAPQVSASSPGDSTTPASQPPVASTPVTAPLLDPNREIVFAYQSEEIQNLPTYKDEFGIVHDPEEFIDVPQVNIDSPDAASFNEEMKKYAEYLTVLYQTSAEERSVDKTQSTFSYIVKDDVLSILIYSSNQSYGPELEYYSTFNLSIATGKELDDREFMALFELEEDYYARIIGNVFANRKNLIESDYMDASATGLLIGEELLMANSRVFGLTNPSDDYKYYKLNPEFDPKLTPDLDPYPEQPRRYWPVSGQGQMNLRFLAYIDEDENPMYIHDRFVPAGGGYFMTPTGFYENEPFSAEFDPLYVRLARDAGFEPETGPLFMSGFLGYASSETNGSISAKITDLLDRFDLSADLFSTCNRYYSPEDRGDEIYLIVPKFNSDVFTFYRLEYDESNQLSSSRIQTAMGPVLFIANVSDLFPDTRVDFNLSEPRASYSPSVSLGDGSNVVDPSIIYDITDLLSEAPESSQEAVDLIARLFPESW